MYERNGRDWKKESTKDDARLRKLQTNFIANILVVDDPANSENNGQIKLFRFGKSIMKKIEEQVKPEFDDQEPCNIFDFWEGKNFKLRCKNNEGGWRDYSVSTWDDPSKIGDDEEIENIYDAEHKLNPFIDPKSFKTYEELSALLTDAMGFES